MGASVLQDGRPTGGRIIHPRDAPFSLTLECFLNTADPDSPPVWSPRDMTGCTASLYLGSTATQSLDPVVSGADDNVVTLSLTRVESLSASGSVWEVKTAGGVGVAGGDWVWASPGETRSPTSTDIITGGRVLMLESEGRVTLQAATAQMPAAAILAELLAVDGAGSGLDADLLDGQSSAHYATAASVTAEALARSTQDGVLSAAITDEATARAAADSALDGRIDTLEADLAAPLAKVSALPLPTRSGVARRPWDASTRPVYLDQYWAHFRGVGFQAVPSIGFSTIATPATQWANTFTVADASFWVAGQSLTIAAGTAQQQVVIVQSIAGSVVTVSGRVEHAWPTGTSVRPTWQNDTHPYNPHGYQALATWIANAIERPPSVVLYQSDMSGTYTDVNGKANCPVGWVSINADVSFISTIWTSSTNPHGRSGTVPYLATTATGGGVRMSTGIPVTPGDSIELHYHIKVQGGAPRVAVHDAVSGALIAFRDYGVNVQPAVRAWTRPDSQSLSFVVPPGTTSIDMRITSTSGVVQVYWDDVIVSRLVEHAESSAFAIDRTDLPIVMLGDSWGLAMHEMLGAALTARSGSPVTVINAAVSGQRLDQMVARFAADVLPHNPGTVVVQYGANDLAASRSQALMEADVDALIALCRSNGIRAVVTGIPPITSVLATAVVRNDQIRQRVMRHAV